MVRCRLARDAVRARTGTDTTSRAVTCRVGVVRPDMTLAGDDGRHGHCAHAHFVFTLLSSYVRIKIKYCFVRDGSSFHARDIVPRVSLVYPR